MSKLRMPKGIKYIVGNEAMERFSFYGMKAILVVYMTQYLMGANGMKDVMNPADAKGWYHIFVMGAYFFPILGSILSDVLWGKYRTIVLISIVYCFGHLALAMDETRLGLSVGLFLIALSSGAIKPVASAHVGDQFSHKTKTLLDKVFGYWYFAINLGAFVSSLLTPILLNQYGPSVAFGVPAVLMAMATIVFWIGHKVYITIPPVGWRQYKKDIFTPAGKKALSKLPIIYLFVAFFWSLFEQIGSSWVLQADHMNRMVDLRFWILQYDWLHFELLASQIQAINPILIMLFIPIFSLYLYPTANKFFDLKPLRKISIGMFLTALSFAIVAIAEMKIQAGQTVSILWQFWAYIILTASEVMVSITCLEFSYTQAPNSMKAVIMGIFFLSVSLGNAFTALVNFFIQNDDGTYKLVGAEYFWFFTGVMAATAILFIFVAERYKEESYIQSHEGLTPHEVETEPY